ncbi:hypothetical protein [Methylobacterium nigriterrae]|uniref:hypothetical protein n=1 Tax=Methylobacterium nigriterrae TaxID=3127512 RepID=UPI003013D015
MVTALALVEEYPYMGDVVHFVRPSANVHHQRWKTVEELGRVGTLAVRIVACSDNPGLLHVVAAGGASGSEVLASADNEPEFVAALRAIGQRVIRLLEVAEVEFFGSPYRPQME